MPETYNFGAFHLDAGEQLLLRNGRPVPLPPKAFDLLLDLVQHAGHLRDKKELMEYLWPGTFVEEANLSYTVSAVRRALGDEREQPRYVETVPKKGYRFVGEVTTNRPQLKGQPPEQVTPTATPAGRARARGAYAGVVAATGLAAAIVTAVGLTGIRWLRPAAAPAVIIRAQLDIGPAEELSSGGYRPHSIWSRVGSRTALAWTPDGRRLVLVGRRHGRQQLYVRDLARSEARPLAGTDGAQVPAVSPSGESVVFWAHDEVRRAPLNGGPVQTLRSGIAVTPSGMCVARDGRVFFGHADGVIWQVGPGSTFIRVSTPVEGDVGHNLPQLLAGDTVLLYTARRSLTTWGEERVVAQVLGRGPQKLVVSDAADARILPSGHLVFMRRGLLMAASFDPERLEVTNDPVGIVSDVAQALTAGNMTDVSGAGQFAVSRDGTLAYVPSQIQLPPSTALVTVDRRGRVAMLPFEPRPYSEQHVSPDGTRLIVGISQITEGGLWLADLARGTIARTAGGMFYGAPRWTPDGQRVAFLGLVGGAYALAWQRPDGSAPAAVLVKDVLIPSSWSPDGRRLATSDFNDIVIVTVEGGKATVAPLARTPKREAAPEFSPDGTWIAYESDATGRSEVYIRPYPGPGPSIPVSSAGGLNPAWNPRGNELFFLEPTSGSETHLRMMAVAVHGDHVGTPRALFEFRDDELSFKCTPVRCYSVGPDGEHFFVTKTLPFDPPPPVTQISLVINWIGEVQAAIVRAQLRGQ